MNRLGLHFLGAGICALLAACEKPTPFEITTPAMSGGSNTPAPAFDASLPSIDARVSGAGDSAAPQELPVGTFTQQALLKAIGDCALDHYRTFVPLTTTLRDATRASADTLTAEASAAAQDAWRAAIAHWQELELFRFGPAGSSAEPGGDDLRNSVYFYPDVNNCQVDLALVNRAYEMGAQVLSVGAKGLGTLEYLLFYAGDSNSCPSGTAINATSGGSTPWQQLDAAERARRRASYAAVVAADLQVQANALVAAWDPAQANFYTHFITAGSGSPLFSRSYDAFEYVDNAMFYFDTELKDYKVAIPAGISDVCVGDVCPESVESRFSLASNANIRGNISGFRLLFNGCGSNYSGLGFDDWLRSIGKADLADRMTSALVAADGAAAGLPQPLELMLTSNLAQVVALHAALKAVSDPFKMDFLSALNLERPAAAVGDND